MFRYLATLTRDVGRKVCKALRKMSRYFCAMQPKL